MTWTVNTTWEALLDYLALLSILGSETIPEDIGIIFCDEIATDKSIFKYAKEEKDVF